MKKKLNIFESEFAARAALKNKEPRLQNYWKTLNLSKLSENKTNNDCFVFHSGPPYANGNIHIGHALNFILKDIAIRFQNKLEKKVNLTPGWDTHGLPIALVINKKRPQLVNNILEFRKICAQFAKEQIDIQIQQLERLGLQINFANNYQTLDKKYISEQLKIFGQIVNKNLIFRSQKPVYWSWSSKTALAETEVIHLTKKSLSAFFLCNILDKNMDDEKAFLVWTTTIWTIPENKMLAVDQKAEYLLLKVSGIRQKIIVGKKMLKKLQTTLNWQKIQEITTYQGEKLVGTVYQHPYLKQKGKLFHSDFVDSKEGTGIVHIAPAFGKDDYLLAKKLKINFDCAIDNNGCFNKFSSDRSLIGVFYSESEASILKMLKIKGQIVKTKIIEHQYPHDWRTKKPVIYRTTFQWYLNLKPLQKKISKIINKVEWIPAWGKKRMNLTLTDRTDWCLSRQRSWGVPIPAFFNKQKKLVLTKQLIDHTAKLIAIHGDQIWWQWPVTKLLTKEQINQFQIAGKGTDTFDVWFDSGCSATIVGKEKEIEVVWEGNDQYRGWFNSLIIISAALDRNFPIKKIITHGFVNDAKGQKMSKSVGNVINPIDVCQNLGADVLRLWVVSSNYFRDVNMSEAVLKQIVKNYTKIRNTIRFLINNLMDFNCQNSAAKLTTIDWWILIKMKALINKSLIDFSNYSYHLFYLKVMDFLTIELSNLYFEYAKNILYTEIPNALNRRQIQTVFAFIIEKLIIILAPILIHTSEEAYQIYKKKQNKKSVHLEKWPQKIKLAIDDWKEIEVAIKIKFFKDLKLDVNKILEEIIKQKVIKLFAEVEIKFSFSSKYQLFKNEREFQLFLAKNQLNSKYSWKRVEKEWKEKWTKTINWKELGLFLQVNKITLNPIQEGMEKKTGFIQFNKVKKKLCNRCTFQFVQKDSLFCEKCQSVLQN